MIVLKIGGSVITDKSKETCFKKNIADQLSACIKKVKNELILVHGAGSFGHITAQKYNLNQGYQKKEQIKGFSVTHYNVQKLNSLMMESLHSNNIPAVSLSPHSIMELDDHKPSEMNYEIFNKFLKNGFTPVTYGDVVLDKKLVFSICSGDLLTQLLAKYFKPEKVIFAIDEDGLYSSNPKINKNAQFIQSITVDELKDLTVSLDKHADVTGGMKGKLDTIEKIANTGIETILVNGNQPERLSKVLNNKKTKCTIIKGG